MYSDHKSGNDKIPTPIIYYSLIHLKKDSITVNNLEHKILLYYTYYLPLPRVGEVE